MTNSQPTSGRPWLLIAGAVIFGGGLATGIVITRSDAPQAAPVPSEARAAARQIDPTPDAPPVPADEERPAPRPSLPESKAWFERPPSAPSPTRTDIPGAGPAALLREPGVPDAGAGSEVVDAGSIGDESAAFVARREPPADALEELKHVDAVRDALGDFEASGTLTERRTGATFSREMVVRHRREGDGLLVLQTKPKLGAANANLRSGGNIWAYDAHDGRWERQRPPGAVLGGSVWLTDLVPGLLASLYEAVVDGPERLGTDDAVRLRLRARPDVPAEVPSMTLWIDASFRPLKVTEFTTDGSAVRTLLFSKYVRLSAEKDPREVWFPTELRVVDEREAGHVITVVFRQVAQAPQDASWFTKAFVESRSR